MISRVLLDWRGKNSLDSENDCIYGTYNEYGFSVCDENNGKLMVITAVAKNDDCYKKLQRFYIALDRFFKNVTVGRVENYLALFIDESKVMITVNELDELIEFTVNNLLTLGFERPVNCYKCGAKTEKFKLENKRVMPVCYECSSKAANMTFEKKQEQQTVVQNYDYPPIENEHEDLTPARSAAASRWAEEDPFGDEYDNDRFYGGYGSYGDGSIITGFISSLLGAAFGALSYVGIYMLTSYQIPVLCVLSPVISGGLYMLLRGRRSKSASNILILLFSLAVSAISVVFVNVCEKLNSFSVSVLDVLSTVSILDTKALIIQIGIAVLGVIVGTVISNKMLSGYIE